MTKQLNYFVLPFFLSLFLSFHSVAQSATKWNQKSALEWFNKREWLNTKSPSATEVKYDSFGRILENETSDTNVAKGSFIQPKQLTPHESINKLEFAKQYNKNERWWREAFAYLEQTDLAALKPGKYLIDGDNVFAIVTEGPARREDTAKWEAHQLYQDIHYVIKGQEKIGVAPVSSATIINPYDLTKDIGFYKAIGKYYTATPGNFFIFFPQDAHKPSLQIKKGDTVKKIVIKVKRG